MRQDTERMAQRRFTAMAWLPLLVALLALGAAPSLAVSFFFTGQVFQVTQEDADDASIPDNGLIGDGRPYAKVQLFDSETDLLLGETIADHEGVFTVTYDQPDLGSTPDIYLRVYQEEADPAVDIELKEARDGMNHFENVGRFDGSGLRVITDEFVAYGADGLIPDSGVGIVFTRVGKVEIPFIEQDTTNDLVGLADFSSDFSRADELHVRRFVQAPFAAGLLIFGEFGLPGGACTGAQIGYYQVNIAKYNTATSTWGADIPWEQQMTKMQTKVSTSPVISVTHNRVPVGPFTGTDSVTSAPVPGLYWVNRNTLGDPSVFYSFPDQRVNWVTTAWPSSGSKADGLYRITMQYYEYIGGLQDAPSVSPLASGCFPGTGPGLHELYLTVNNDSLVTSFDHIYLRDGSGDYYPATGTIPTGDVNQALDFANQGLCDIMNVDNTYNIEVHFTAHHQGSYMRYYNLYAQPNTGSTVNFTNLVEYPTPPATPSPAPFWEGTPSGGTIATALNGEFVPCGYDFQLSAGSRLQNGYQHTQSSHPDLAFYVMKPPTP